MNTERIHEIVFELNKNDNLYKVINTGGMIAPKKVEVFI